MRRDGHRVAPRQNTMSRRALTVKASALVMFVLVATVWMVVDRVVTVHVDGARQVVHTRDKDVRTLLASLGQQIKKHDRVSPTLDASLRDGLRVDLDRARPLRLTIDGHTSRVWVTARTVRDALLEVKAPKGTDGTPVRVSADRDKKVPLSGMSLEVSRLKKITLVVGKDRTEIESFAPTVNALLKERKMRLDDDDRTDPSRSTVLTGGATVTVRHVTVRTETETVTTPAPEEVTEDADLMQDQTKTLESGSDGRAEQTVKYYEADGDVLERKVVATKTLSEAKPKKLVKGTKAYPEDDTGRNWAGLAQCESGGNPRAVSPNGSYHGLYQFSVSTWERTGGIGLPSEATSREQTYRAMLLYKRAGAGQWPVCGAKL